MLLLLTCATVPVCDECEVVSLRNDKRTDDRSQQLHKRTWEVGTPFSFARSTNSTPPPQLTNAPTRPQRPKQSRDYL